MKYLPSVIVLLSLVSLTIAHDSRMSKSARRKLKKTDKPTASPTKSKAPTAEPTTPPTKAPTSEPTTPPTETHAPTSPHRPNLIMILTDQHNVRTLGCYREIFKNLNQTEQAYVWGDGVKVETPNIDQLAKEGVLFSNFHTVAPLCTPSRASFMTGLYPQKTGDTGENHGKMDRSVTTFANVLRMSNYKTGYFGKWHLNGHERPGWGSNERKFGFQDNKHLWNRGHWKFIDEINGTMKEYSFEDKKLFKGIEDKHFTTDYLFDRGIDFIEEAKERNEAFAIVLSIPDPHSPNDVRQPYENMYKHMNFSVPFTARTALTKNPAVPDWQYHDHDNVPITQAEAYLNRYEESAFFQTYLNQYFGMVKCIDDNVGKLMNYLKQSGLGNDETIIVFTSDHGDMLGEHGKMNKGRPYRGSAAVPFIIRYPGRISQGKIIKTARSSIDFTPSILSLMGATDDSLQFDGVDFTREVLNPNNMTNWGKIVFSFDTGRSPLWVAAIKKQHKLVISVAGVPWLFDLEKDPYEIVNFFDDPNYSEIKDELLDALFVEMKEHDIPMMHSTRFIFWSTPACMDSKDRIEISKGERYISCADLDSSSGKCNKEKFKELCPVTCGKCCMNTVQKPLWVDGELKYCQDLRGLCHKNKVQKFCPATCMRFTGCPSVG